MRGHRRRALRPPRVPPLERLTNAAIAYAARHEEIAELTRSAKAVPGCAIPDPDGSFAVNYCSDRIPYRGSSPDENPELIRWWEATDEEIASFCGPCRSRVDLWGERYRLKTGVGGLKRALLWAYRAWKTCP
jgi:hypothetical protein